MLALDEHSHLPLDAPTIHVIGAVSARLSRLDTEANGSPQWRGGGWKLHWSCEPATLGWLLSEGGTPRYVCSVDERLGVVLGRWRRGEMERVLATPGNATELFKQRWRALEGARSPPPSLSEAPPSFIQSAFTSRVEYEAWLREA